jgi:hypothetical protein
VLRNMRLHRALDMLADECGFSDIIPMVSCVWEKSGIKAIL